MEAALAVGRMGMSAAIVTMDPQRLALMSCNPAVGGIGKSHLVKEIDALGGVMGLATDATGIQFRRLNLSRGPAVWSTRVQCDRTRYNQFICDYVAAQEKVAVIEGLASEIVASNGRIRGIRTEDGRTIETGAVVIATGTFLGGLIHIGEKKIKAGRIGENAAYGLSDSFRSFGFEVGRLKTGTPPRLDGDTIDWSKCRIQPGDEPPPLFSHRSPQRTIDQVPCHITYTTPATKELIAANFKRSPIFSGQISSTGPRYCPSIEDKFFRFADKEGHQIFLEPEGNGTNQVYPNGFSTALPEDIQIRAIRTVIGLENVTLVRPGYAVEYDYCPAHQVKPSLETRLIRGLFLAGQINGTSGYEEAGGQGLMAGINAVQYLREEEPFVLDRSEAYIGVMIDDLTTRSTTEPYRLFTSRAEYRLAIREDNARDRLSEYAHRYGLISEAEYEEFRRLQEETESVIGKVGKKRLDLGELPELAERFKNPDSIDLANLFRQPSVTLERAMELVAQFDGDLSENREALERAYINVRYAGYIAKQEREIEKFKRMEHERIPESFPFDRLLGLRNEAREKFTRFRPSSLGQAGRIEGVTAGDLAVLSIHLKKFQSTGG